MLKSLKRQKIQFAALPFRPNLDGRLEVLLITSRDTGRWVIPKGWPMKGKKPFDAAAQEAWEEAGVLGSVAHKALGQFDYQKASPDRTSSTKLTVKVFPLKVEVADSAWPEFGQRRRSWFAPEEASTLVDEKELAALIRAFAKSYAKTSKRSGKASDTTPRSPLVEAA